MKPESSSQDPDILRLLKDMESLKAEYPTELLSARRAAFLDQVAQHTQVEVEEELSPADQEVVQLLRRLRLLEHLYPARLLAARRSAYQREITGMKWMRWWNALRSAMQQRAISLPTLQSFSPTSWMRTTLIVVSLALAVFASVLASRNPEQSFAPISPPQGMIGSGSIVTTHPRVIRIFCKTGYEPPMCLEGEFEKDQELTHQDNGTARPAVAKDTMPGDGGIYRAAYVNDGRYGPGTSWVSNSRNSWIKIDLGKATPINTVTFGRDRLGELNDGDPGQFVVAVAIADNVYADGNNSNDLQEYTQVYRSEEAGFNGMISGDETVTAQFEPRVARFIKITFENEGATVDEVEAFMVQPPVVSGQPEEQPTDQGPESIPTHPATATPYPFNTPTSIPTNTAIPTDTATPVPTDTPLPTDTPVPTDTPLPPPTNTPVPTDTAEPPPTEPPIPEDTPIPDPTNDIPGPPFSDDWPPGPPFPEDWPPGLYRNTYRQTVLQYDP